MMTKIVDRYWKKLSDEVPENGQEVIVTDKRQYALMRMNGIKENYFWEGVGFSGYEWELDFSPTHWIKIVIEL